MGWDMVRGGEGLACLSAGKASKMKKGREVEWRFESKLSVGNRTPLAVYCLPLKVFQGLLQIQWLTALRETSGRACKERQQSSGM